MRWIVTDEPVEKHYAVVANGVCVNVIVWDPSVEYSCEDGAELVDLEGFYAGIGWTYNPKATKYKWIAPEEATDGDD